MDSSWPHFVVKEFLADKKAGESMTQHKNAFSDKIRNAKYHQTTDTTVFVVTFVTVIFFQKLIFLFLLQRPTEAGRHGLTGRRVAPIAISTAGGHALALRPATGDSTVQDQTCRTETALKDIAKVGLL